MKYRVLGVVAGVATIFAAQTLSVDAIADDDNDGRSEHRYVRLVHTDKVDQAGYGFCEFTRKGRTVWARLRVTGAEYNGFVTAWKILNGGGAVRLDGTVATGAGDAELSGHFRIRGTTEIKLDARGHLTTIQDIGNIPIDEQADLDLIKELTTFDGIGGSEMLGTCTTTFESRRRRDRDENDD